MSTIIGLVSTFRLPLQGRHVEVQKRSQDIEDWTLKWREGTRKSKKRSRDVTYWMLELSEGTKKSKGKQTQEPSKQAASQACQSRLKVND